MDRAFWFGLALFEGVLALIPPHIVWVDLICAAAAGLFLTLGLLNPAKQKAPE